MAVHTDHVVQQPRVTADLPGHNILRNLVHGLETNEVVGERLEHLLRWHMLLHQQHQILHTETWWWTQVRQNTPSTVVRHQDAFVPHYLALQCFAWVTQTSLHLHVHKTFHGKTTFRRLTEWARRDVVEHGGNELGHEGWYQGRILRPRVGVVSQRDVQTQLHVFHVPMLLLAHASLHTTH